MTFDELISAMKEIKVTEMRGQNGRSLELVVSVAQLGPAEDLLRKYFDAPLKPAGEKASAEAVGFAEAYGGIMAAQTLFARKVAAGMDVAMLWPWSNGTSITIKIFGA